MCLRAQGGSVVRGRIACGSPFKRRDCANVHTGGWVGSKFIYHIGSKMIFSHLYLTYCVYLLKLLFRYCNICVYIVYMVYATQPLCFLFNLFQARSQEEEGGGGLVFKPCECNILVQLVFGYSCIILCF